MKFALKILKDFPAYLWSGWGAVASILLFIAIWDMGNQIYGDLVLPSPLETFKTLNLMLHDDNVINEIKITLYRSSIGFSISLLFGTALGLLAGFFATASMMSRPIVTILVGMPPIAWIVLAMIWFGMGDETVIFTVIVASFPIIFVGALQGTRTLDGDLKEMAQSFNFPWHMKFLDVYFPHIFSYVFPAWVSALGMAWKIVIMAELLATSDGIGATLATARSQLDTPTALSIVVIMIGSLMFIEYIILEPIKREVELWRD
ncbi:MAG: ABC transporter permease [Sulfurimonas sp.]|jgi:NitT/TauT family transport system permease protein|uniref:ABC transporter permease n=1 Tax=unclassified Sulfurimonas TaxID=2623549 RepID=UPI0008AB5ADF|nr:MULTISPECIES: ABC transporter permease [unclassified Sulfurimonas]OHE11530.1 MAG: ABC transporter permease [Sulfurimonas sp. RIFOXYB2_FULL_37_5]OHE15400.1 MAG: ABC transporter permease [Sulfurimonas sp. RIFOXYD2_FULL_37_8]OHE20084.1 MAG: ABC transporter permease [Sulfurimonas sp. RIFOXYD12_FULL_36_11]MBS4068541.1 ABC transporter permease [Sulfurimonas sp.]MDD3854978.1 ABC transporter permease [Sulfurimonas sp.]